MSALQDIALNLDAADLPHGTTVMVCPIGCTAKTLPTGLLDNEAVHLQLQRLFDQPGRTNDFRQLRARLTGPQDFRNLIVARRGIEGKKAAVTLGTLTRAPSRSANSRCQAAVSSSTLTTMTGGGTCSA